MRLKGKKPIFNYSDTFSLDSVLAPIIKAGLIRFRDVLVERDAKGGCLGVPCGIDRIHYIPFNEIKDDDLSEALQEWLNIIDKMILGFSEEPDIDDYDFNYSFDKGQIKCNNTEEKERYREDCKKHREQRLEGRELFAKHFEDLWW